MEDLREITRKRAERIRKFNSILRIGLIVIVFSLVGLVCYIKSKAYDNVKYQIQADKENYYTNSIKQTKEGCIEFTEVEHNRHITMCGAYRFIELN